MIRSPLYISLITLMLLLQGQLLAAQDKATHTIHFNIPSKGTGMDHMIFRQVIDGVSLQTEDTTRNWQLYQEIDGQWVKRVSQIESGHIVILHGEYRDSGQKGDPLKFRWRQEENQPETPVKITDNGKELTFLYKETPLVTYRYQLMPVPEGVSQIYSRSGFVHPLKTMGGNVVSRIQPPDHYHHYGLWHPWTHTEYNGEEIDFWNLNKGQGTVAFQEILSVNKGPLFTDLTVVHHHKIHPGQGEQTVLKETLTYRLWVLPETEDYYLLDVLYHMYPSTDRPLIIKEYRYQGFSLRGPEHWSDDNVSLLTSAGKDKSNGNASRARWMKVTGPGDKTEESTVIMMTNPANYNFPELIRIWPTGANQGKANVFLNFNPAQDRDWVMEPGRTYSMRYRMIIADRDFSPEETDRLWSIYTGASGNEE